MNNTCIACGSIVPEGRQICLSCEDYIKNYDVGKVKIIGKFIQKQKTEENEMEIKIKLDEGAFMPESAHEEDAGYDLRTPTDCFIPAGSFGIIDTGVHMAIPKGYVGFLKSKSGLNVRDHITGEGVIDSGYTGSIKVKLYQHNSTVDGGKLFRRGDKIIQIVLLPIIKPRLVLCDSLEETERGDNGFGSTGR